MRMTVVRIVVEVGLEKLENRKNRDYPDRSIFKIGWNTEKSSGDLKRLAVTQTLVKDHQLVLVRKNRKEFNNYNNSNSVMKFYDN